VIYPVLSIVVNWIGHANYRIGQAESQHWTNLASNHTIHHQLGRKNYAFGIHLLDIIYAKLERLIDPKKKKQ